MRHSSFKAMVWALAPCALVICGCVPVPKLLLDIGTTNQGSNLQALVPTTNGFYVVATMGQYGEELFYTPDGTVSGATQQNLLDVRPGAMSSSPRSVYAVGERAFFMADDGTEPNAATNPQQSLFVTDGTRSTTVRLRAPAPGLTFTAFAPWGTSGALFKMSDANNGEELYRTDGTAAGTQRIADINPSGSSQPAGMTKVGSNYVFAATDGTGDRELWRTDGTTAARVVDLNATGSSAPVGFTALGSKVYFSAKLASGATALYATDGTAAGTTRVTSIDFSSVQIGAATSSLLFFIANKRELWVSNGTAAGTQSIATITLDSSQSPPENFRTAGNRVLFYVATDESDMDLVEDVWSSDGTADGTFVLFPGTTTYHHGLSFGSKLYYTTYSTLSRTDGTVAGTETVYTAPGFNPNGLTAIHGKLLFASIDAAHGSELWSMDGSVGGAPTFFCDVNTATSSSYADGFFAFGTKTLFRASGPAGMEPWVTDGTAAGTRMLADINPSGDSFPAAFTESNGVVYFAAKDGAHGTSLWRTDGTSAGTFFVKDIDPNNNESELLPFKGPNAIYLSASDSLHGGELWRTDGTAAGTVLVSDINPGSAWSRPLAFASIGNKVVFTARTDALGTELWTSDGTTAGTQLVKDIAPGTDSSNIYASPVPMGSFLYFAATDIVHGAEIWRTDGTAAGTTRVTDLNPGSGDATRGDLVVVGNALYFDGSDGTNGFNWELWKTDGTTVTNISGGINPNGSNAVPGVAVGGTFYFIATDPVRGSQLFATDGTAASVRRVTDVKPTTLYGENSGTMIAFGGALYFAGEDGPNDAELWSTDGTPEGTVMHTGLDHDPYSSSPSALFVNGGTLFLQLMTPMTGAEPYTLTP